MINNKKANKAIVAILVFSMMATYLGVMPLARAATLTNVKDTISDSSPTASTTHAITFRPYTADLTTGEYVRVTFDSNFSNVSQANVICPTNGTASSTVEDVADCIVGATTWASTTDYTINISGVTNPAVGSYLITVETYSAADALIDSAEARVYIIETVSMTAHVPASLTFSVAQVDAGQSVNGVVTTAASSNTTIPFGDLDATSSSTVAQQLSVATNASQGYVVTVKNNGNLVNGAGADIDSFNNGVDPGATPEVWAGPDGTFASEETWGHIGVTTNDNDNDTVHDMTVFAGSKYTGIDTTPRTVMAHNGPSDGTTQNSGLARVAYTVEISALQDAGDYTATLEYIVTPTY